MNRTPYVFVLLALLAFAGSSTAIVFADDPGVAAIATPQPTAGGLQMKALILPSGVHAAYPASKAIAYVQSSPPPFAQKGAFTVVSAKFLTVADASKQIPTIAGVLEGHRTAVCVVSIRGNFVVAAPPTITPLRFQQAYVIFDALTGNYLGFSGVLKE